MVDQDEARGLTPKHRRYSRTFIALSVFQSLLFGLIMGASTVSAATDQWDPSVQTPVKGTAVGTFPDALEVSDGVYIDTEEDNQAPAGSDVAPDVEQLIRGSSVGFANLLADDASNWVGTEAAIGGNTQQYAPGSSTKLKGTLTAGTEPTCWTTSDDSRCTYQEADQAAAPTDLTPDTETLTKGTTIAGTFNADVISDNGATITYREANQNPSDVDTYIYPVAGTSTYFNGWDSQNAGCTATTHQDCVEEVWPPDDATSYVIALTTLSDKESHLMADLSITAGFTDIDITIEYRCAATTGSAGGDSAMMIVVGAEEFINGVNNCIATWTTFTIMRETSPSGDEWTAADVNAAECGYVSGTDLNPDAYVSACRLRIQVFYAADYEIDIRYDWSSETCALTRRLTVNAWHTNTEDILIQVWDFGTSAWNTRATITATADGTTYTWDLGGTNEWNSGSPRIRYLGNTEVGDATQTDLLVDYAVVRCVSAADFELEVKFSWTGVSTTGTEWRLFVEGREGASNPEQMDVKIYAADETSLSAIVCSITSTTEASYDCGALTADQLDTGTPDILVIDNNQAGDASQSTVDIDYIRIQRTFERYELSQAHKWVTTVTSADAYQLRVRAFRSDEDVQVRVWDWIGLAWNVRATVSTGSETLYTYTLTADERAANGTVMSHWLGTSESSSDETQSTATVDQEIVQRTFDSDYESEVKYDWTGVNTTGNSWTLVVECKRTANPENYLVQVVDSTEMTWTTLYTCDQDTDTTYNTYVLTADELDGGAPNARIVDIDQASDGSQSSWNLDSMWIVRDYTPAPPGGGGANWVPFVLILIVTMPILGWSLLERD